MTTWRSKQAMPPGRFSVRHYKNLHKHIFQDVYAWAGKLRSVRITKDNSTFCYPENIENEMTNLFNRLRKDRYLKGLDRSAFADKAAHLLAELNAIHPFREGNGRTQLAFLTLLSIEAGHPIDTERMNPKDVMNAMITSFGGAEEPLADLIREYFI